MKKYEITFIVGENFTEDKAREIAKDIRNLFESNGGKIEKDFYWGKRKLAYKIAKNTFGYYFILIFDIDSSKIGIINHDLQFNDKIIRYLLVDFIENSPFFELEPDKDKKAALAGKPVRKPETRKPSPVYEETAKPDEEPVVTEKEVVEEIEDKVAETPVEETLEVVSEETKEETVEPVEEEPVVEEKVEEPAPVQEEDANAKAEEKEVKPDEEPEVERKTAKKMTSEERKDQLEKRLAELLKDEEI